MAGFRTDDIRRYYDRNTPSFVALGQGGGIGAIHRAVWGPGVATRDQAFRYAEDRVAAVVRPLLGSSRATPVHVVDLGCGVGSSLCYLAERLPIRGTGITISPVQARLAAERISARGLAGRVACLTGDYNALPASIGTADVAYAIESFVHGPDPARFLAEAAALLSPAGTLVICDDVRRPGATGARARRTLDQFRRGWHVNTLLTRGELTGLARNAGFALESVEDLTPLLELRRPRDRAIAAAVGVLGWLTLDRTRLGPLIGGAALQRGLARGWIGYDLLVFRRTAAGG